MSLNIIHPFQARCDDRSHHAEAFADPTTWVKAAMPAGIVALNFQFFIDWNRPSYPVTGPFWITRLLACNSPDTIIKCTDQQVTSAWQSSTESHSLEQVAAFCEPLGISAEGIILPEVPIKQLNKNSPVWKMSRSAMQSKWTVSRLDLVLLQAEITRYRGGLTAALGSKGLIYGTSAVECWMSTTQCIYPGDADCLLVRGERTIALLEFKKHTLGRPIGENLASRYYPRPDGRKYDSLNSLSRLLGQKSGAIVPIVIVYFATRFEKLRIQRIDVVTGNQIVAKYDSGDIDVTNATSSEKGSIILTEAGIK